MKQLNVTFDDEDFERLEAEKNESRLSWREFIIMLNDTFQELNKNIRRRNAIQKASEEGSS